MHTILTKPLSASVSDLTTQLRQVPESLSQLETNLASSGTSLDKVGNDAKLLAVSLGSVQEEMAELVGVIEQYETQVKAFQGTVRNLRENINDDCLGYRPLSYIFAFLAWRDDGADLVDGVGLDGIETNVV